MDSVRVDQLERESLVEVTWLPFELHPEVPPEGIPREAYFGARAADMEARVRQMGEAVGLVMRQRDRLINSRQALAAAEFAREQGRFEAMHRALFKAHWELTGDLDRVDDLKRIGASVGLDPEALEAALAEGRFETTLDASRRDAEGAGINAIPAHVFDRRFLVLGAQPEEVFRQVLARLAS